MAAMTCMLPPNICTGPGPAGPYTWWNSIASNENGNRPNNSSFCHYACRVYEVWTMTCHLTEMMRPCFVFQPRTGPLAELTPNWTRMNNSLLSVFILI